MPDRSTTRPAARPSADRETWIFLPLAVILLVVLSLFTLLSYRNGLELLAEDRREQALRSAERLARSPGAAASRPRLEIDGETVRALVVGSDGAVLFAAGRPLPGLPLGPVGNRPPEAPSVVEIEDEGSLAAFAPVAGPRPRSSRVVRVDIPTPVLASQRRAADVLTVVVVTADVAVALWLVLFLRRILSPYDALLAAARAHGHGKDDEATFLLRTLERALREEPGPEEPEAAGAETELRLLQRTLGASLEEGLLLVDARGAVLLANPRARELLSISSLPPRSSLEVSLAAHPELLGAIRAPLRDGVALPPREVRISSGGEESRIAVSVTPLRRMAGELMGFLVLVSDVTGVSRRAEERRLAESLAQLGELAAGVAHELRNGIATIRGYLQLLERPEPAERRDRFLAELDAETRHLERVVADFLSFARPGTSRPEPVALGDLLERLASQPGIPAVRLELEDRGIEVPGDPILLSRAFDNLLRNARDAQGEAGSEDAVRITLARSGDGARVEILDRGRGLPEAVRERLFHPFTTTRPQGAGLGLALAHRVVTMHGGTIRLEDREEGGTRVVVWLPGGLPLTPDTSETPRGRAS